MKSYKQYCGVARALDRVGQRWTLLLVRELLLGPRRFTDLKLPGLNPTLLSQRLRELEAFGLVEPVVLPPPAGRAWALTAQGERLRPVVLALGSFGQAFLAAPEDDDVVSHRWLVVSLQRRWSGHGEGVVELGFDGVPYTVILEGGQLRAVDGAPPQADARLSGPALSMAGVLGRGMVPPPDVVVQGSERLIQDLLKGLSMMELPNG